MSSPYRFKLRQEFRFRDLSAEFLWAKLCERERFGDWWPWMRDLKSRGKDLEPGAGFDFTVVSPLPYKMRLDVEIVDSTRPDLIDARVTGDLEGEAGIELIEESTDVTLAIVHWDVEVRDRAMRVGARVARPLIRWGQDWALRVALERFRSHLVEEQRADHLDG